MKKLIVGTALFLSALGVAWACTTNVVVIDGRQVVCVTCCTGGSCVTTCN